MAGRFNDLWKYNIASNQWTWVKGTGTANDTGNYGTKCVPADANTPPARMENRARVRDASGNFWNFGGLGPGPGGELNDLWHYNVFTNQWTWVSGDDVPNQAGIYGVQSTSNPANKPGARYGGLAWIDDKEYIWVFGGLNYTNTDWFNDLFRYAPDSSCVPFYSLVMVSPDVSICNGNSATLTASGSVSYFWSPGGEATPGIVVSPSVSTAYTVTSANINGCTSTDKVTVTVNPLPAVTAWNDVTITAGNSAILNSNSTPPALAYSWSPSAGLSCVTCRNPAASPSITTVYCVTITDSNGCTGTACVTVTVAEAPVDCSKERELYLPNAFSPNGNGENDVFEIYFGDINCIKTFKLFIYNRWGEKVYETSNPGFKWNGSYKNEYWNSTVFIYYLKGDLISGEEIIKKGNISLIR